MKLEQQPARILVVDDESPILLTMEALLRRRGYAVTTAPSGEEAVRLIDQSPFELLLLDLMMPGISGLEVARYARKVQPSAAVLILTGSTPIEGTLEDLDFEGFDYVIKTASPKDVLARVAQTIASK